MSEMIDNRRIARNTLLLYFRLFFMVAIQLYTVPILLNTLGAEDYGLYNVIGSIMVLASLVSFLTSGSQRFFSFAIGENDNEKLENLFISTRTICLILTIVVLLLLEIAGIWFVKYKMQIPDGRQDTAIWVFELSVVAFCIGLISIPYKALIVAHERMGFYAYVSIGSSFLKLLSALALQYMNYNLLVIYSLFILLIQIIERIAEQIYCYNHFPESRSMRFFVDKKISSDLMIYSGFNVIGGLAFTLRNQGLNVLMNLFFGTIINAAHTIASQINNVVYQLINSLYQASRPQITKSYASGDVNSMWKLVFRTSLLSYYLVMLIVVVAIFELPTILTLWLHNVPAFTVEIARVMLICFMMETIINQLISVLQAMNRIKECQLFSCVILLLHLPLAYLVLRNDTTEVLSPYYIQFVLSFLYVLSIVVVTNRVAKLNICKFFKTILLREVIITAFVMMTAYTITINFAPSLLRVIFVTACTIVVEFALVITFGFERTDLNYIRNTMIVKLKKNIN